MGNKTRSDLNLWAQLSFEIPRLAAADLALVILVSSFVFSAACQVLSSVRSFCVLPSNYSVYVYVSPERPFVYRKNRRESSYSCSLVRGAVEFCKLTPRTSGPQYPFWQVKGGLLQVSSYYTLQQHHAICVGYRNSHTRWKKINSSGGKKYCF